MAFIKENLNSTYSSDEDSLLKDFYIPSLEQSVKYDRAVGFFSASMLTYAMQGISAFINNNGKMRLIIGEDVDDDEFDAILEGHRIKSINERLDDKFSSLVSNCADELLSHRLNLLSWMVSTGCLEIKLAIRRKGMYHEKIGVMEDGEGNRIVFQGSANETVSALVPDFNFESISVYPSWNEEVFTDYGEKYISRFQRLWDGRIKNTITVDVPSDLYEKIRKHYVSNTPPDSIELEIYDSILNEVKEHRRVYLPKTIGDQKYSLKEHQQEALENWRANDFQGIFALATGAGKTITALHAAVKIANHDKGKVALVVAVPYQILADQWAEVMRLFNIEAVKCYKSKTQWYNELETEIANFNLLDEKEFLAVIVVNATLAKAEFQTLLSNIPKQRLIFVGDECHHHGSPSLIKHLPDAKFKIGLSATPWSSQEEEKRDILTNYYGPVVAKYSIDDALRDSVLTQYDYHIHPIQLSQDECLRYEELSKIIGQMLAIKHSGGKIDDKELTAKLMERARVIGSAEQKFSMLAKLATKANLRAHTLFYCGDGSVELDETEPSVRDVQRVARILSENRWKTSRFTAEETYRQRERILENFKHNIIDAIVAIRVLDEGFDIPACQTAFLLASSRNERQFIQRRGRILRKSPGKDYSVIHDFIVLPADHNRNEIFTELVRKEMQRVAEFIRVAKNKDEIYNEAEELASDYDVDLLELIECSEIREFEL